MIRVQPLGIGQNRPIWTFAWRFVRPGDPNYAVIERKQMLKLLGIPYLGRQSKRAILAKEIV
jgi:hypothetical protein